MKRSINKLKVKVLREKDAGIRKISWPSADSSTPSAPIVLPSQPLVELVKREDGKSVIVVTCTCGKRTEIVCDV